MSAEDPWILPYQSRLLRDGGYLYFAFPFIEPIRRQDPRLARGMIRHWTRHGNNEDVRKVLSEENLRGKLRYYALRRALEDCFYHATGVRRSSGTVVGIAAELYPQVVREVMADSTIKKDLSSLLYGHEPNLSLSGLESLPMTLSEFYATVRTSLARRGAIVYYNERLLSNSIKVGQEDEAEITIVSQEPISYKAISGIKLLSEADKGTLVEAQ